MDKCSDCGLPLLGTECEGEWQAVLKFVDGKTVDTGEKTPGHPEQCCDCFDEMFGKPKYKRNRPRPDATPEELAKHAEYWAWIVEKKAKRGGFN